MVIHPRHGGVVAGRTRAQTAGEISHLGPNRVKLRLQRLSVLVLPQIGLDLCPHFCNFRLRLFLLLCIKRDEGGGVKAQIVRPIEVFAPFIRHLGRAAHQLGELCIESSVACCEVEEDLRVASQPFWILGAPHVFFVRATTDSILGSACPLELEDEGRVGLEHVPEILTDRRTIVVKEKHCGLGNKNCHGHPIAVGAFVPPFPSADLS
mmetsp:Transcript_8250/g.19053  ORF Transcript_8250/g.19053 Transcript_8250/m.19053 type:complete len:208 (-) Transcript_8250:170-793(-)